MTHAQRYQATLFNQFLSQEFGRARGNPSEIKGCLGRALRRFSPSITVGELQDYTDAIHDTIVSDEGVLLTDWPQLILTEHWR